MTRGRLTAYLRYQLQDFALQRAALPTLLVLMFGGMTWFGITRNADMSDPRAARFMGDQFRTFAGIFITLGVFLGVARIVSEDRGGGYVRFFFSKPVSLVRFYLQQWIAFGLALILIAGALGALWQAGTVPQPVGGVMVVMGFTWVLIGGAGFLISALTNHDIAILVAVYGGTSVLRSLRDMPNSPLWPWLSQLARVLPPTQKVDYIRTVVYAGGDIPWMHAAHVLAYGLGCLALGIVALRRTNLAR